MDQSTLNESSDFEKNKAALVRLLTAAKGI
jgi:hypothetical protein